MPFVSQKQRAWMYANDPKMAKRWSAHTPKGKKLPKHVNEGPQDLEWETDPETETLVAKTPAGTYEIWPEGGVGFHPSPGTTEKRFDQDTQSVDQAKKIASDHWKNLQQKRKFDEPLPMPGGPQSAAFRGGTKHGRYNKFGKTGMSHLDLNSKEIEEMPHIDADIDLKGKHVSIIDLRIERYPIPKPERDRLMKAFSKTGVVGNFEGELIHFKPDYTIDVIDQAAAKRLPMLPKGWEKVMQSTNESRTLPTMRELFKTNKDEE